MSLISCNTMKMLLQDTMSQEKKAYVYALCSKYRTNNFGNNYLNIYNMSIATVGVLKGVLNSEK